MFVWQGKLIWSVLPVQEVYGYHRPPIFSGWLTKGIQHVTTTQNEQQIILRGRPEHTKRQKFFHLLGKSSAYKAFLRERPCNEIVPVHGWRPIHQEGIFVNLPLPPSNLESENPCSNYWLSWQIPLQERHKLSLLFSLMVYSATHSLHMRTDICIQYLYS